jgi:hypothetical protein
MEKREEVVRRLGPSYNLLLEEIENGSITQDQVEAISVHMGGTIHTVYKEKAQNRDIGLPRIFEYMVNRWYRETIYHPQVDAHAALIKILKSERGLEYLVYSMEEAHQKDKK